MWGKPRTKDPIHNITLAKGQETINLCFQTIPIRVRPASYQVLEELCQKNNWGQPVYQLHSAIGPDQRQLFLYKITIPALATQYPNVYVSTGAAE